jgi:hypothetical protein
LLKKEQELKREFSMKYFFKARFVPFLWIIAFVAVIGAILAGCASLTVVGVDSVTGPQQVRQYGTISSADVTVNAVYKDGSTKQARLTRDSVSFDSSKTGTQTVTVKVSGSVSATFEVEVMPLTGISIASSPRAFKLGVEDRGWPGLEVQASWDQMGSEKINTADCQITGFDTNKEGKQTVTIAWKGAQTSFDLEVVAMTNMRIASAPTKTTYYPGETLSLAGLKVMGTWPGIGEEEISVARTGVAGYNVTGYSATMGKQTITVAMNGKTATFDVTVAIPPVTLADFNGRWGNGAVKDSDWYSYYTISATEITNYFVMNKQKIISIYRITSTKPVQNTNAEGKTECPNGFEFTGYRTSFTADGVESPDMTGVDKTRTYTFFMHHDKKHLGYIIPPLTSSQKETFMKYTKE